MRIQTFSIVIGSAACDAHCPFCVSHTTGFEQLPAVGSINIKEFETACLAAFRGECTTVLFTGKGEPFLYPDQIIKYLYELERVHGEFGVYFPFIEIQTNGLKIAEAIAEDSDLLHQLEEMRDTRLRTIALSTVGIEPVANKETYLHHRKMNYPDLATTVQYIKEEGFKVRLCVMMRKGAVDTPTKVDEVIAWCKDHGVDQLTIRPIRKPVQRGRLHVLGSDPYVDYITNHGLDSEQEQAIEEHVSSRGTYLMTIMKGTPHAAQILDVDGQNVCLSDCLTQNSPHEIDEIRTLIFFADGGLSYDWQFKGAVL